MIKKISKNSQKPRINVHEPIINLTLPRSTTVSAMSIGTYLPDALTDEYSAAPPPAAQARASAFDEKLAAFDKDPTLICA